MGGGGGKAVLQRGEGDAAAGWEGGYPRRGMRRGREQRGTAGGGRDSCKAPAARPLSPRLPAREARAVRADSRQWRGRAGELRHIGMSACSPRPRATRSGHRAVGPHNTGARVAGPGSRLMSPSPLAGAVAWAGVQAASGAASWEVEEAACTRSSTSLGDRWKSSRPGGLWQIRRCLAGACLS